jgi:hypothetical protein
MILRWRDINDTAGENLYLRRWILSLPFGWSIKVHKIVQPDHDRCQHDHPWAFVRIILWGGYIEERGNKIVTLKPWRPWAPWRIYPVWGRFKHRIDHLLKDESWTIMLCSPRFQEWGFYLKSGWMHWRKFINAATNKRVLWCEDGEVLNETPVVSRSK